MNNYTTTKENSLKRLLKNLRKQRYLAISATTCSILNKIFDLAPPVLIGLSVDVVTREESSWIASLGFINVPSQITLLAIISLIIWTAESGFEYLYGLLWRDLAQIAQHNLRIKAYSHLQKLEMAFFESDSTGRLMTVLNDDINQLERFLDHGANQIIQLLVTVFLVGGAMVFIAPGVASFAFIPIPIILIGSINYQKKLAPKYTQVREKAGNLASRLSNNLGGMLTIKSFATEEWELKRVIKDSYDYLNSNRKAIKLSAAFIPLIRFAILFAFLAILIIGGFKTWSNEMQIGTYSFLIFITQRLLWPLTTLGNTLDEYQRSMASTNRVLNLIDTPLDIEDGNQLITPNNIAGNIKFKDVNFNYKDRPLVFDDLNLELPAGSITGIVGSTGSGKSTLVKLLLRLYKLNSGSILIDDKEIKRFKLEELRRCIALVTQEVYLFDGTIAENICYGKENISLKKIQEAAELAEASRFIQELPFGYETIVGERGQRLSGGQRQRIALARAILKNAPILILDEATASVDNETEAAIQRSLEKISSNRTTLIIAHRLSTVRNADMIIVLNKGYIAQKGSHENLIKEEGIYNDLWKVQAGIY